MNKTIIMSGGLGNQMFQYAFYKSMLYHEIKCSLNTDLYSVVKMHNGCELFKVFGIVNQHRVCKASVYLTRFLYKFKLKPFVYEEKKYIYNENVYHSKALLFIGTWINEMYLKNIEHEIRHLYIFKNIDKENVEISNNMKNQNSVSIHIRRGDYLSNANLNVCDKDYYTRAINYIRKQVNNPIFYVFSDDPFWCDHFLRDFGIEYKCITNNRNENSYKDMYLMSNCKHNINANSTFSWWGSWLNSNPQKIVIMPKKWTMETNENPACSTWIKL